MRVRVCVCGHDRTVINTLHNLYNHSHQRNGVGNVCSETNALFIEAFSRSVLLLPCISYLCLHLYALSPIWVLVVPGAFSFPGLYSEDVIPGEEKVIEMTFVSPVTRRRRMISDQWSPRILGRLRETM